MELIRDGFSWPVGGAQGLVLPSGGITAKRSKRFARMEGQQCARINKVRRAMKPGNVTNLHANASQVVLGPILC